MRRELVTVRRPLRWVELEVSPHERLRGVMATRYNTRTKLVEMGVHRPCDRHCPFVPAHAPACLPRRRLHAAAARQRRVADSLLVVLHTHFDGGLEATADLFERCMLIFSTQLIGDEVTPLHFAWARDRSLPHLPNVRSLDVTRRPRSSWERTAPQAHAIGPPFVIHSDEAA